MHRRVLAEDFRPQGHGLGKRHTERAHDQIPGAGARRCVRVPLRPIKDLELLLFDGDEFTRHSAIYRTLGGPDQGGNLPSSAWAIVPAAPLNDGGLT
jgi:hypothetical protein